MSAAYLALQLVVCVAAIATWLLARLGPRLDARSLSGLHYAAAVMVVAMAMLAPWIPAGWLAASADAVHPRAISHELGPLAGDSPVSGIVPSAGWPGFENLFTIFTALSVLAGTAVAWRWAADARRLRLLRQRAQLLRRQGRVRIWICDDAPSPYSFHDGRHAHVVIPQFVVARRDWFRLALAHELQHHRQRDTAWLYLFGVLRVACALNPFAWTWSAAVARQQELACDEAVLARGRWSVAGYAQGLLDVARAAAPHRGLAWAPSLIGTRHSLKRRIEEMMNPKQTLRRAPRIALYTSLMTAFALAAAAASSLTGEADAGGKPITASKGALPIRTGALAASFEFPEEGATKRAHAGVDIAAAAGTPVYAWHEGVVVHAGARKGCGTAVVLQHWQGTRSVYCNLAELKVTAGESVGRDQALGQLANLGPKKSHLHFEIEVDGRNVDPARQVDLLALK
jgi:hypothetical protein